MLDKVIPSYLYLEYSDDLDLQAFVQSFNTLSQEYVTWFRDIGLPVYTGDLIAGALLDWVALGLYGFKRPSLPIGIETEIGEYNTPQFNELVYNGRKILNPAVYYVADDDIFKRCITWNFYKGDGTVFNINWLKRRIQRFLDGPNGTDPGIQQTYQISVTFGPPGQVNIFLTSGTRIVTGGALFNKAGYNTTGYNTLTSYFIPGVPIVLAPIFQAAIEAGVLNLPFQKTFVVSY
jgi:hypothetical protein